MLLDLLLVRFNFYRASVHIDIAILSVCQSVCLSVRP